jgi:uncharacterized DUF497 family protein
MLNKLKFDAPDPEKNKSNKSKHGIDFEEAKAIWGDRNRLEKMLDYEGEKRYSVYGLINGKLWTAIICYRGKNNDKIRIISVRRSRKDERESYDKNY